MLIEVQWNTRSVTQHAASRHNYTMIWQYLYEVRRNSHIVETDFPYYRWKYVSSKNRTVDLVTNYPIWRETDVLKSIPKYRKVDQSTQGTGSKYINTLLITFQMRDCCIVENELPALSTYYTLWWKNTRIKGSKPQTIDLVKKKKARMLNHTTKNAGRREVENYEI